MEEEVAVMGERGQIVIPAEIRRELGFTPKTKFLVRGRGKTVILQKLDLELERKEMQRIWEGIDKSFKGKKRPTEKEILDEVEAYRRERAMKGAA